ncbi:MAG TPA: VCBS repeat-containing protein [Opitutus sp.]|nr:VCBS repeat-containing protein [Opitutus sp.]
MSPRPWSKPVDLAESVFACGRSIVLAGLVLAGGVAAAAELQETPLAPRSGPRGATMFREMPPAETGIVTENDYTDPAMWGEHYREFSQGTVGTGVAIGDYDGDGRPDIFVVSKTGRCRLFRNLGDWKFEDVTDRAGLDGATGGWIETAKNWVGLAKEKTADTPEHWKQGAVFADVNNDGRLDLYVCRFNAPNWLFINQGDGTFKEEAAARGLAVVDASGVGAFCDYDRDGWLDVYVTTSMLDSTRHPNGQRGYLFHNNGDGTFADVTGQAGITGESLSHSATWWDYDGDGWPDLYVANDFAGADRLYHNAGDGTFRDVIRWAVPHMPYSSMGADLGDVDNDGREDFFVADMAATSHEMDQRGMAYSRSAGDMAEAGARAAPQSSRNALYLATGMRHCREGAYLAGVATTDWTWAPRLEDLDNDGRLDLFVTNGMTREFQNADLLDRSLRAGSTAERIGIMRASPRLREANLAYRNLGDLRFKETGEEWGLNQRGVSFGAAFGDLDGDGDLDLVYANYNGGLTVLRNDCETGHRVVVALRGTQSNRFGIGATVRIETASGVQVRTLSIARGYLSSSEPMAHFGLGADARIKRLTVHWPAGSRESFENLPVDRKFTITESSGPRPRMEKPLPYGEKSLEPEAAAEGVVAQPRQFTEVYEARRLVYVASDEEAAPTALPARGERRDPTAVVGDLARDGGQDLVLGATGGEPLRIVSDGNVQQLATGGGADGPMAIFDADGDGVNDLIVTKAEAAPPQLFLNDGRGTLRPAPRAALPEIAISGGAVAVADFDRDGRPDVFVGARWLTGEYPEPPRSVLWRHRELIAGGGSNQPAGSADIDGSRTDPWFEDVAPEIAPGLEHVGLVTAAVWSDVDGDGWPDLIVACEWGHVSCFHNDHGKRFEDWTEKLGFAAAGTGWWCALASGDFNGDGRPDFVAGNVGLNTRYRADAAHPALWFAGDFAGRGRPQLVEAYFENGKLYPWATRRDLGALVPAVLRRYTRNDAYARATLPEILGADKLARAQQFAATELRSGVFLSQPDGTYRFEPLPRIAQIAPLTGIVTGDFDGDGFADIYAVQNSFAANGGVERCDGGLSQLLRGDGRGSFTPVPPADSGLVVPDLAKAVVVVDFDRDGWPDILVARANGKIRAFHNNGVPGRWPPGFRDRIRSRS